MKKNTVEEKYNAQMATVIDHNKWVKTPARALDLGNEMHIANALYDTMEYFQNLYNFAGVSSNNIYWNMTDSPVRMLYIPLTVRKFIAVINPKYIKLSGNNINSIERCGSVPNKSYRVTRKSYVSISGYTIDKKYIELEYGKKKTQKGKAVSNDFAWVIQHEMDHLDGITIQEKIG